MNKKIKLSLVSVALLSLFFAVNLVLADSSANTAGYAWGGYTNPSGTGIDGVGWISFNSTNETGTTANYGVSLSTTTDEFSGTAWSSNFGWLSFDRSRTGNPPGSIADDPGNGSGAIAKRSGNAIVGWARFLAGTDATENGSYWDGWLSLSPKTGDTVSYGVTANDATGYLSGYAWGGKENVGLVSFDLVAFGTSTPVVASCGSAATNYPNGSSNFSGDFCSNGSTPTPSPAFPSNNSSTQWSCPGVVGICVAGNNITSVAVDISVQAPGSSGFVSSNITVDSGQNIKLKWDTENVIQSTCQAIATDGSVWSTDVSTQSNGTTNNINLVNNTGSVVTKTYSLRCKRADQALNWKISNLISVSINPSIIINNPGTTCVPRANMKRCDISAATGTSAFYKSYGSCSGATVDGQCEYECINDTFVLRGTVTNGTCVRKSSTVEN